MKERENKARPSKQKREYQRKFCEGAVPLIKENNIN